MLTSQAGAEGSQSVTPQSKQEEDHKRVKLYSISRYSSPLSHYQLQLYTPSNTNLLGTHNSNRSTPEMLGASHASTIELRSVGQQTQGAELLGGATTKEKYDPIREAADLEKRSN